MKKLVMVAALSALAGGAYADELGGGFGDLAIGAGAVKASVPADNAVIRPALYEAQGEPVSSESGGFVRVMKAHGGRGEVISLVCESIGHRYSQCSVAGRVADVWLEHQISNSPCSPNVSFGRGDTFVWVDKGCRAQFGVRLYGGHDWPPPWGPGGPGYQQVRCESQGHGYQTCGTGFRRITDIRLTRQLSNSPCSGNWGYRGGFIWVDRGCRADFAVWGI